jgi:putative ABC transport system permease protein
MILIFTVRTDVLDDWQKQLPDNAPNHFVLNIFPQQANAFKQQLQQLNITDAQFYPVVRGRLVKINDIAVQQIVSKDSQGERATHRDLSLTWAERLPKDNKTIAGTWSSEQKGQLSIEQKLANSLHVSLGDKLTFTIGSQQVQASISHIRSVQWDSMKPNFYMLFSPGTLENYPSTLITSFYLTDTNKNHLNILVKEFPSITILEVDLIIKQFKIILTQLTAAINYLLYFSLLAGFTVLFATVYSTLDHRIYESTLMRTFGASQRLLTTSHLIEFSLIGLLSGLIAVFMSELIIYTLYTLVLHLDYHISNLLWWFVPLLSSLCITAAGTFAVRDVVNKSPMQVLREL